MSLYNDLAILNTDVKINEKTIGLALFENLRSNPIFNNYQATTLYRAYIMEYVILLWDNAYTLLINKNTSNLKLKGITESLLGSDFIHSSGYKKLIELELFLENNYFDRYALNRYLTQAFSNYLFNKQEHYTHISLDRIYSNKIRKQYLEISQGLADKTVYKDNLSFTEDPVTMALINYYYYLDKNKYYNLVNTFKLSLATCLDKDIKCYFNKIEAIDDKSLMMHYINTIGIIKDSFTVSYGNNLLINQDILTYSDTSKQMQADNYLIGGQECSTAVTITLALSRLGTYHKLLTVVCKKQLGCLPITKKQLNEYKEIGFNISDISRK